MLLSTLFTVGAAILPVHGLHLPRTSTSTASPSLTTLNATQWVLSNGADLNMTLNSRGYAYSIMWNGLELARNTTGGYSDSNAGKVVFNFTQGPSVVQQTDDMLHVAFEGYYTTIHYILFGGLSGHYQYVVNNNLDPQGEVRSLYRLDPNLFTNGKTPCRDAPLPPIQEIQTGFKVQDETWQQRDGSYVTKYDFSCFQRETPWHGVYGDKVGAWVIAPGLDYIRGDHLAQELMVHRESSTNHAVLLHMIHGRSGMRGLADVGTHFTTTFSNDISKGKMFGPWLFYINDGDLDDVASRSAYEEGQWPYAWTGNQAYSDRGTVKGRLTLSDGRPASGAAVFLGDEDGSETGNQGEYYQYTTYASDDGSFQIDNVRREKGYRLIAWSNGGTIGDVVGLYNGTMVAWSNDTADVDLGDITWDLPKRSQTLWQIGVFDKKTTGFKLGGDTRGPYANGVSDYTPTNFIFPIGTKQDCDWSFAQTGQGNWTVLFDPIPSDLAQRSNGTAMLSLSFAGWSSGTFSDPADLGPVPALNISMNTQLVGQGYSSNDKALYRSATTSGGWQMLQVEVPTGAFYTNRTNRLDL